MRAGIRPAGPGDAPAIHACVAAAYSKYVERIGREPAPMLEDHAALVGTGRLWVLVEDEEVLGTLVARPEADHLFVGSVAVRPERQGEGLGRELMAFVEGKAVEAGLPE